MDRVGAEESRGNVDVMDAHHVDLLLRPLLRDLLARLLGGAAVDPSRQGPPGAVV